MRTLVEAADVARGLRRIASEIAEHHASGDVLLIGVRRGGDRVAEHLAEALEQLTGRRPPLGSVDITLYRDDAAAALPNPRIGPSHIPFALEGKPVVLVDDVLHTRRTIRAAMDAVLDFGRPANIELAVVIDRAGRQLPIQPDYRVLRVETVAADERIDVVEGKDGLYAVIQPVGAPSMPPTAL